MQRRARLQSTLVGAFMVMAATFSSAAHASEWHSDHGYSGGGTYHEFYAQWFMGAHLWSYNGFASAIQLKWNDSRGQVGWTSIYGNTGGEDWGSGLCPDGHVVGIYGKEGFYVDALGVICGDGTKIPVTAAGGGGGSDFTDTCGPQGRVTGIRLRAGSWIDQIAIECSSW